MDTENAIFVGPWGNPGDNQFDDGSYSGVAQIVVMHGGCIDSLRILYDRNGDPVWSEKHGGGGGTGSASEVNLDFPSEYLTGISGYIGTQNTQEVIKSLTFTSNVATYGPFGQEVGTPFSLPMRGGKIVGFAGTFSNFLRDIGFYIRHS